MASNTHTELVNFDPSGRRRLVHATELHDDPNLFVSDAFDRPLTIREIELYAVTHDVEVRLICWGGAVEDDESEDS